MTDMTTLSAKLTGVEDIRRFLDGLFAHAPVGFGVIQADGHVLVVNQAFSQLFGSSPPPEYNLFADEQAEALGLLAMIRRSFAGETVQTPVVWYDPRELRQITVTEGRRAAISMKTFPLYDAGGAVEYVVASYRDHTEESLAREHVEAERDRFRALFVHMIEGILLLNQDGCFVEVNPSAGRMLGLETEALVGRSFADFSLDSARMQAAWERFVTQGQLRGETTIRRADGSCCELEYACQSQFAPGLYLVMLRDLTEQKRLQREHAALEEQLRQAQKLEAIGRLAGSVAHDFNNLLTVINGYSELLLAELPADASEAMQQIYHAGQQAAALTSQLLAFGRKSILNPIRLDLNSVIHKLTKMLRRLLPANIELEMQLEPGLDQVLIDPSQFEQVVMNLVLNARDAMPDGGLLLIKTTSLVLSEKYDETHADIEAGRYVMLAVSDNGVGMDEITRQRIFEPFYTTKTDGQGTGLGLSTVHGIVRQSGGHIFVYSEPSHGTSFKLYFPSLSESEVTETSDALAVALPEGQETVFLAEDVQEVREFIKLVLESCGYRVLDAAGGQQALEQFADAADSCDLLITDVIMPKMSGPRLAEALQERNPRLRVLYISGYTDDAVLRYGILTSGIPFLAKPFTPSQLAQKVREVLDGRG